MKNKRFKAMITVFLCLSVIMSNISLTWINAVEEENSQQNQVTEENSVITGEEVEEDINKEEVEENIEEDIEQDIEQDINNKDEDEDKLEEEIEIEDKDENSSSDVEEEVKEDNIKPRYSEQNPGEGDRYTSDEEWVPQNMEKKQIQNSKFSDDKSVVYLIMADGFQNNSQDKSKFEKEAKAMMDYLNSITPYNEYKDITSAYTIYTPSNESGATLDMNYEDYKKEYLQTGKEVEFKDTFFRCSFNVLSDENYNYERLLEPTMAGMQRAVDVAKEYNVPYDQLIIISNSDRYGGSGLSSVWPDYTADSSNGGTVTTKSTNIAVSSTHTASHEVVAHEVGHALGSLADEYWPGEVFAEELANMTQNNNPETIKWKKFMEYGENTGIGIHTYEGYGDPAAEKWYRPTKQQCKMEVLSTSTVDYEFCEVCREGFRESMSKFSNATVMYWQDYGKNSKPANAQKNTIDKTGYKTSYAYTGKVITEIESSFIVRHGQEILDKSQIEFTYYDSNKKELEAAPKNPGKYYVKAVYKSSNKKYNDCEYEKGFEIIESKTPVWNEIEDLEVIYTGKAIKLEEPTYTIESTSGIKADKISYRYISKDGSYDSEVAPKDAGEYTVKIEASINDYPEYTYKDSANLTIKKANLTITADDKTIKQDEELPKSTYTIKGFVNDESEDVFTSNTLKAVYKNEDTSEVGKYTISMTGEIVANNYDYKLEDGTLEVVKKNSILDPEEDDEDDQDEENTDEENDKDEDLSGGEENPQTGDNISTLLYSTMALVAGFGMFFTMGKNKW